MASQKLIAQMLGLSTTTVSQVLRKYPKCTVSKKTRRRILKAAEQLDYVPNQLAVSLRKQRTDVVGVMVPRLDSYPMMWCLKGLQEGLHKNGYVTSIRSTDGRPESEQQALNWFRGQKVDGLIVSRMMEWTDHDIGLDALVRSGMPVVALACWPGLVCDSVGADGYGAGQIAVEHLLSLGHRRIAVLRTTCVVETTNMHDLDRGVCETIGSSRNYALITPDAVFTKPQAMPMYEDPQQVPTIVAGALFEQGYVAAKHFLAINNKFTAVICHGDEIATGAVACFREANLRVPEDIAVIGVDNEPYAPYLDPPLTTVDLGTIQQGQVAAELLVKKLQTCGDNGNGKTSGPVHHKIKPTLIVRRSCGANGGA